MYLRTWDSFLISRDLSARKAKFASTVGSENIFYYPNPEEQIDEIIWSIAGWWLFAAKKLLIINNLPRSADTAKSASEKILKLWEYILSHYRNFDADMTLCLVSPKPDWRTKIFKDISGISWLIRKEYTYSDAIASQIIKENCPNITTDATNHLIYICDSDLRKIHQESTKLWFLNKQINIDDINNYVLSSKELDPFGLMSYIVNNDNAKIISLINNKSQFSEDNSEFLGAVRWTLRIAILYYEAMQISSDSQVIATKTKLSPMQLWSLRKNASWISQNITNLKTKYQKTIELEYNLKTGWMPRELWRLIIKDILLNL